MPYNAHSAEAWVFTDEIHRRRGFAKRVVRAWAQRIREQGRIPFYSHRIDNPVSQHLAESLGFVWYIDDAGYE
ncbi:MAG TPA: GNAT family N-acetyltransferase [Spirillospora sp.]|nr:GNAT family N-acetyltransferase [Spirillospora sp.]